MMTEISATVPDNGSIAAIGVTRATPVMPKMRPHSSTLLALAVVLSSCAGHPKGVMTPIAVSAQSPTASKVDMLVATSRLASDNPATLFGGERSPKPSLTDITISIPADSTRKAGDVQWPKHLPPNPKTDFAVTSVKPMTTVQEGFAWFKQHGNGGHALVFIHGFSNTYEDAVFRYAQIVQIRSTGDADHVHLAVGARPRLRLTREHQLFRTAENTLRYLSRTRCATSPFLPIRWERGWRWNRPGDGDPDGKVDATTSSRLARHRCRRLARQFAGLAITARNSRLVSQDDRALAASRMISGGVIRVGASIRQPNRTSQLERADHCHRPDQGQDRRQHEPQQARSPRIVQLIGHGWSRARPRRERKPRQGVGSVAGTAMTINNAATNVITAPSTPSPPQENAHRRSAADGILKSGAAPSGMTN